MSGWAFLVLLAVILGPCHLYLWLRLVRDTTRTKRARWIGAALFVLPIGALLVAFSARVRDYVDLPRLTTAAHTQRIVDAINGMNADLIAVVGDLVDDQVEELRDQAEPLRHLQSRDGAYFVTGNHDYYSGVEPWINHLRELGLHPLRNERVQLHGIELAGTDDITGNSDVAAALKGRDPALPAILLAHQPVVVHEAARHGVDLQLSGHTHGGQMVPLNLLARAYQPVISGLANVDGTAIYVTNGAGFWGPPVRVGAPPDVTLVELRSPA